jgi:hypothetical protein
MAERSPELYKQGFIGLSPAVQIALVAQSANDESSSILSAILARAWSKYTPEAHLRNHYKKTLETLPEGPRKSMMNVCSYVLQEYSCQGMSMFSAYAELPEVEKRGLLEGAAIMVFRELFQTDIDQMNSGIIPLIESMPEFVQEQAGREAIRIYVQQYHSGANHLAHSYKLTTLPDYHFCVN